MMLSEYVSKRIFTEKGLKVPRGRVASTPEEAERIACELGVPLAVKAQVLVGGRGLVGGIRFAEDAEQAKEVAGEILGGVLRGRDVDRVLVEEKIQIDREYYASLTLDYDNRCPVVIVSSEGGVDIEATAREHPEAIVRELVDRQLGLTDYQARRIAKNVGLEGREMMQFAGVISSLHRIIHEYDASLVEINPLVLSGERVFIAADAKIILDDSAYFRHRELYAGLEANKRMPEGGGGLRKALAEKAEIPTYIELEGGIGIIADGAGTGMLTFDLVKDHGGEIETYCELGGKATPALIKEAMRIVLSNDSVRVLLVNLIGGLNRMDEMAKGIVAYVSEKRPVEAEVVVRMSGTMEQEGREILRTQGITAYDNIYEAIERAVELSGGV
jgi:succinyl-CoA synthetase beta subunit